MASRAAGTLGILGILLLALSFFVVYYSASITVSGGGNSAIASNALYLTGQTQSTYNRSAPNLSAVEIVTQSDSAAGLGHVGTDYAVGGGVSIGAIVAGAVGSLLSLRGTARWGFLGFALGVILAASGPVGLAVAQPTAWTADVHGVPSQTLGSGPWTSFTGSCQGAACGDTIVPCGDPQAGISCSGTWEPGGGWYFSLVASILMLVAAVLTRPRPRPRPPPTAIGASATSRHLEGDSPAASAATAEQSSAALEISGPDVFPSRRRRWSAGLSPPPVPRARPPPSVECGPGTSGTGSRSPWSSSRSRSPSS